MSEQTKRKREQSGTSDAAHDETPDIERIAADVDCMQKMALLHDITFDQRFQLPDADGSSSDGGSSASVLKKIAFQAFWDVLASRLNADPPDYNHALNLLKEIKEDLFSVTLPYNRQLRTDISERLDLDLIQQQCEHNCVDLHAILQYVVSVMAKVCAPVRDEKVAELTKIKDVVALFRGIYETIELMRIDMANFTISSMRPVVQRYSVEYERKQFEKFVQRSPDRLQYTKQWLRNAVKIVAEESRLKTASDAKKQCSSATDDSQVSSGSSSPAKFRREFKNKASLMANAYWILLKASDEYEFPETLCVDKPRFLELQQECLKIVLVASVMAVVSGITARLVTDVDKLQTDLKTQLLVLVNGTNEKDFSSTVESIAEQVVHVLKGMLKEDLKDGSEEQLSLVKAQVLMLSDPANQVRRLIESRLKRFLVGLFLTPVSDGSTVVPLGLTSFQHELAYFASGFLTLVSYNREVYAKYYDDILDEIAAEQATD